MIQAFFYEHRGKYEKALDKYESLFALIPPPLVMLYHLGDVYLANGMLESAATAYRAVLQADLNNIHSLRKLGRIYLDQGKVAEAKPIYDRLSSVAADNRTVMKEVSDAYATITIEKGRWEEAVSFRQKVAGDTAGEDGEAPERKGEPIEPIPAGDSSERIGILKRTLEKDAHNTDLRKELAELLLEKKHTDGAISEYRKIVDINPEDIASRETLASLYREAGDIQKAVREYERLNKLFPDRLDILGTLAELLCEQDAPEEAIEVYQRIIGLSADDPDAHEALGKLYEQTRHFEDAILEYEKVLSLDPERKKVEESLGNLYLRDGKNAKAIEKFERVIGKDKTNTGLRKILGDLYLRENLYDKARTTCEEILQISPDDVPAKARLQEIEAAELDGKVDEIDKQVKEYEKAGAAEPDNCDVRNKLEKAKLARLDLHIQALENRSKASPDNPEFHYQLGVACRKRGYSDRALKELQLAVNDEARSIESLHLIGLCFEDKNILDIAARQLEKAAGKSDEMNDTRKAILYDLGRIYEKMNREQDALGKYKEIYEVDIGYRDVSAKIEKAYKNQTSDPRP
jgi:tetratricopeptide (TPR) repeat protein